MKYQVVLKPAAQRKLRKLPYAVQKDLINLLERLSEDPRPRGCKKLKGRQNLYRVRSGEYRVIYGIEDSALIVRVINLGHRRDVYED
jgi:mRNA interferase RelE/StbE